MLVELMHDFDIVLLNEVPHVCARERRVAACHCRRLTISLARLNPRVVSAGVGVQVVSFHSQKLYRAGDQVGVQRGEDLRVRWFCNRHLAATDASVRPRGCAAFVLRRCRIQLERCQTRAT